MIPQLPILVERTLARLIRAFAPEKIILFGSYAKGVNDQNSDVDLLVIAHITANHALYSRRARQLTSDSFPSVDVVFATPEDVASASLLRSPFLLSIMEKGVVIYTRENGLSIASTLQP